MTSTSRLRPDRSAAPRLRRTPPPDVLVFHTPVRGHAFAARPPGGDAVAAGRPARLVREPENPRDPLAVAVWSSAGTPWRLGYLDRAVAARLAPRLDDGQRFAVEVDGWVDAPGSAWRRPLLRVTSSAGRDPGASSPAARAPGASSPAAQDEVPREGLAARPPGVRRRVVAHR